PNFITLNAAHRQIAHDPIVVFGASASHLLQKAQDSGLGNPGYANSAINGSPFDQGSYYSGAFISGELVHPVLRCKHQTGLDYTCLHGKMQADFSRRDASMENEPVGRAKGGIARAEILSPERRSEIARLAALTKHGKLPLPDGELPKAIGEGILRIGDVD